MRWNLETSSDNLPTYKISPISLKNQSEIWFLHFVDPFLSLTQVSDFQKMRYCLERELPWIYVAYIWCSSFLLSNFVYPDFKHNIKTEPLRTTIMTTITLRYTLMKSSCSIIWWRIGKIYYCNMMRSGKLIKNNRLDI